VIYGFYGIIGVRVPLNFRQPFSSTNIVEYWRAWHISLSMVLKALFYHPTKRFLGTNFAILLVYLASAMWHGVTANFFLLGSFSCINIYFDNSVLKKGSSFYSICINDTRCGDRPSVIC